MIAGVKFNNLHSYKDFHLLTNKIEIGYPAVKTNYVDIPGGNGALDLTEANGGVKYKPRQITFYFTMLGNAEEEKTKIAGYLHGRKMKIILDRDSDYYYYGRCSVSSWKNNAKLSELIVDAECEPYKYHLKESLHTEEVVGEKEFIIPNNSMPAIPVIETESDMAVIFERIALTIPKGKHKVLDITLGCGNNRFICKGNGKITFTWQEGAI